MRFLRSVLGLSLALVLVATSLSLAAARGQPMPAGEIVICSGMGLQTISVDAEGNPVGAAHICPDGIAALAALALPEPGPEPRQVSERFLLTCRVALQAPGRTWERPRSRGPPDLT